MEQRVLLPDQTTITFERETAPVAFVPTPSAPYRQHRKAAQLLDQPGLPRGADEPPPGKVPCPMPSARAC
ncbi:MULTISPECIES: hypothetical protein [unclassified Massilia]|uniref:hypothetical protein n=1 Tax=unclassified Massilia TaxID=2609279 RepID=UPI001E65CAFC|nr:MULTISPECIES: hypothetical protein [unclassified Massilia]